MGYLATEIIALLAGAAVLGFIIGWAAFGIRKKAVVAAPVSTGLSTTNPKLEADVKVAVEARKKAEARIIELEAKESNFNDRLSERDTKVAELSHQLDELAKIRVEAAAEKSNTEQKDQRIAALEAQLRQRDAEVAKLATSAGSDAVALELQQQVVDRERQVTKLKAELEALQSQISPDAAKVPDLQAEIAELRATLVATAGAAPTTASEKDAIIGRLNEEVTGLRAAYEAAEQALEEQDAAIDKLTRELVQHQQRVAALEGRDQARPASGVTPRPPTNPSNPAPPVGAVAGAPKPVAPMQGTQVFKSSPIAEALRAEPPRFEPKPEAPRFDTKPEPRPEPPRFDTKPEPRPEPPKPVEPPKPAPRIEIDESTMAVSLEDLVAAVDKRPDPPKAIEIGESTVAIPLAELVAKIEKAPPAPLPPTAPPQVDADESTVAIALADLVSQIDTRPPKPPTPPPVTPTPPSPPPQVDANESTVAISVADLLGRIDAKPVVEVSESTVAMVLPAELLDESPHVGEGDDLKRIKGIGPATEKRLNGAGITRWSQVADLNDNDLPAIADLLKVSVDKIKPWVEQAKALRS